METGHERAVHLQKTIVIGVIFYGSYQMTNYLLMDDIFWLGLCLRILVMAGSIGIVWAVPRLTARNREWLVTAGMLNACAMPVFLFWATRNPLGLYTVLEAALTMVFGTLMLVLRFRHAVIFIAGSFMMALTAMMTKENLSGDLEVAFVFQFFTAAIFVLYGNYSVEKVRRSSYLASLREILRSDRLETDKQEFARLSTTDGLTGLSNRRHLDELLSKRDGLVAENRPAVAVLMIDVDHFKAYNDTYGHRIGDDCLRMTADAIAAAIRADCDLAFRYGGEEFTVLMRENDPTCMEMIAARIRSAVEQLGLPHSGRPDGMTVVTVSIGGAIAPAGDPIASDRLITSADAALYDAKHSGRNRICLRPSAPSNPPDPKLAHAA